MSNRYPQLAHGSTKQQATALQSGGRTSYEDDPLSDYEDNRRSRPNTIRSHIKPAKNCNAYANGRSEPRPTDIIPMASLNKNRWLYGKPDNPIEKRVEYFCRAQNKARVAQQSRRVPNLRKAEIKREPAVTSRMLASMNSANNSTKYVGSSSRYKIPEKTAANIKRIIENQARSHMKGNSNKVVMREPSATPSYSSMAYNNSK